VDWARFGATFMAARRRRLLDLIPAAVAPVPEPAADDGFARRLAEAPESERAGLVLDLVTTQAAAVLRYGPEEVLDPARAFRDLGFDSLTAVDLRSALGRATGLALPTTLVFDHPNALALSEHLQRRLLPETNGDDLDAGLHRLERAVASGEVTEAERSRVTERLRLLLDRLGAADERTALDRTALDGTALSPRLDSVPGSDDDLFAFIDDQLGSP
jgi:polyketide synthase 7